MSNLQSSIFNLQSPKGDQMTHIFSCGECGRRYPIDEIRYRCDCGAPLEIVTEEAIHVSRETFDARLGVRRLPYASGVWRFREMLPPLDDAHIVSRPEGNT